MADFEKSFNYDDVFLREATVAFISQFYRKLRWYNTYDDKQTLVTVPFYYSITGDERFLLDAFLDDTIGSRPELNIDPIPRAHVILTARTNKTSEYSNPNAPVQVYKDIDGQLQKVTTTYRILPLKLTYDITIYLSTEIDMFKCEQSIWDLFYLYRYFHFDYKYFRIDCIMLIPDANNTEIQREIAGITGEDRKTIKLSVDIHTFYPIEPQKAPLISANKKVSFKGSVWNLRSETNKRNFLGTDIFKDL